MPFISIRILEGHSQERKDELARRISQAVTEVAKVPKEAVWVAFEEVAAENWYIGETSISRMQKA